MSTFIWQHRLDRCLKPAICLRLSCAAVHGAGARDAGYWDHRPCLLCHGGWWTAVHLHSNTDLLLLTRVLICSRRYKFPTSRLSILFASMLFVWVLNIYKTESIWDHRCVFCYFTVVLLHTATANGFQMVTSGAQSKAISDWAITSLEVRHWTTQNS